MLNTSNTALRSKPLLAAAMLVATFVLAAAPQRAHAYDIFVNLGTDVKLASPTKGFEDYGKCATLSFGVVHPVNYGGGSSPEISQPAVTQIDLTRALDSSSAALWLAALKATKLAVVKLVLVDSMAKKIVEIELKNAFVTSYNVSGSTGGDSTPFESFSLSFAQMKYTTRSLDSKGAAVSSTGTWDLASPVL